jgi:hypothetical protein
VNVHRQALRRTYLESFAAPSARRARVRGIGRRTTASKRRSDVTDPIADVIGDDRAFAAQQRDRLLARGIDIAPYERAGRRADDGCSSRSCRRGPPAGPERS